MSSFSLSSSPVLWLCYLGGEQQRRLRHEKLKYSIFITWLQPSSAVNRPNVMCGKREVFGVQNISCNSERQHKTQAKKKKNLKINHQNFLDAM